ncbi:ATP-dependent DNA helicase [Fusarium oxysporum f. sp. albedinis]|nr:ATP-dependent DNA helicase [Fusarium oxysporum f. sp. albedinis]
MRKRKMLSQAVLSLVVMVNLALAANNSLVASIEPPIEGFEVQEASWEFDIIEGQQPIVFNGTVEEVWTQLNEEYPEYAAKALDRINNYVDGYNTRSDSDTDVLDKRDHNVCRTFTWAKQDHIYRGISYLRGVGGRPRIRAGPQVCDRVSCSYDSAIWWCNDQNSRVVELGSFSNIADAAQLIVNSCSEWFFDGSLDSGWYVNARLGPTTLQIHVDHI